MVQAFKSQGSLVEYWTIDVLDEYWAIHTGVAGTIGEWQVQEFLDPAGARESAAELIAAQKRAGFRPDPAFDPAGDVYLDDPAYGAHPLTTHPAFRAHFTEEFYLDEVDDSGPFGNEIGMETLATLNEAFTGRTRPDALTFATTLVTETWEKQFSDPAAEPAPGADYWQPSGAAVSDQAIVAVAFGSIKITGTLPGQLRAQALAALQRRLAAGLPDGEPDEAAERMIADLTALAVNG